MNDPKQQAFAQTFKMLLAMMWSLTEFHPDVIKTPTAHFEYRAYMGKLSSVFGYPPYKADLPTLAPLAGPAQMVRIVSVFLEDLAYEANMISQADAEVLFNLGINLSVAIGDYYDALMEQGEIHDHD